MGHENNHQCLKVLMVQQWLQSSVGAALDRKFLFMPNTYSQIYLQIVFAVQHRQALIPREHKEELHKYITGIVQNRKSKMIAVHCCQTMHTFL